VTQNEGLLFLARVLSPSHGEDGTARALRDDIDRGAVVWEAVVELASCHLVTPALYDGFADKGLLPDLPADVRSYLDAVHELNAERNRRIADQLRGILSALNGAGIEPVLLKGVAHLLAGLYGDSAARVIGDIDLLVPNGQLAAAVQALAAIGYREAGLDDFSFAAHHHHTPLAREHDVAAVELHTDLVYATFSRLLPAGRVRQDARRLQVDGLGMWLPSPQDQVVHNIVHTQLADRNYWSGRVSLRNLSDLARFRLAADGEIDWEKVRDTFDRAGYGNACRAYLMTVERLLGQALPPGFRPTLGARIGCWRIDAQERRSWLMAVGERYGYHRAMLNELCADPGQRRRLLSRLLHPRGYRRYLRSLRMHVRRAG
jgi:hypothetical protein